MAEYEIFLPEDSSAGSCIATFATCLNSIGLELGLRINAGMTKQFGATWFSALEDQRFKEAKERGKQYNEARSVFDISWIVNEPFHNSNSPIRQFLPSGVQGFYYALKNMVTIRNQWFHDFANHSLTNLEKALELFRYIAETCELQITGQIVEVETRVNEIASGKFKKSATTKEFVSAKAEVNKKEPIQQKAVGALWIGDPGSRKLELKESGALIDSALKRNVIEEMTPEQKEIYMPLWKSQIGKGWLFVDGLGQVGGYVAGQLRMIGFLGSDAEALDEDPFSKFLLAYTYFFDGRNVIESTSGSLLDIEGVDKVTNSTLERVDDIIGLNEPFRCTWDGELVNFGDSGPNYIGEIEFEHWFPGHRSF